MDKKKQNFITWALDQREIQRFNEKTSDNRYEFEVRTQKDLEQMLIVSGSLALKFDFYILSERTYQIQIIDMFDPNLLNYLIQTD